MKGVVILSLLASAMLAAPAVQAQNRVVTRAMPVSGNTPQVCALQPGRVRTGELVNFQGNDGDTLRVLTLVDPATLVARAAKATVLLEGVCNFPHRVRVESQDNGLWPNEGPVAPTSTEFATALPYQISFTWADRSGTLEADAKIRQPHEVHAEIDEPAAGQLELSIEIDAGASNTQLGAPVLAGDYADTLRIFLEPR